MRAFKATSLSGIGDAPDAALLRVGHVQRAVRTRRESHRAVGGVARVVAFERAREAVGEFLVLARGLAVLHRLEHDLVARLRLRRAIPAPVESNESAVLILL